MQVQFAVSFFDDFFKLNKFNMDMEFIQEDVEE
jgi:hypothetical protein